MVDENPDKYLLEIQQMLMNKTYKVSSYNYKTINDRGKQRLLAKLPYYPDRIIQWAIMLVIGPILDKNFCYHTCASLPQRGASRAQKLLRKYIRQCNDEPYCLKLDIYHFYPSIDKEILKSQLETKFKDKELLQLLFQIIDSYKLTGIPIGSYLSQYLANFYLSGFDHYLKEQLKCKFVIRYMDDIVIIADNKEFLHNILTVVEEYLDINLNLKLKPNYQIFPVKSRGVDFVGYRQFIGYSLLRKSTTIRMKKKMKKLQSRTQLSYSDCCSIRSYYGWLSHCDSTRLRRKYMNSCMKRITTKGSKTITAQAEIPVYKLLY